MRVSCDRVSVVRRVESFIFMVKLQVRDQCSDFTLKMLDWITHSKCWVLNDILGGFDNPDNSCMLHAGFMRGRDCLVHLHAFIFDIMEPHSHGIDT